MGDVYDQFELELSSLSRKYARNPRRQMIRLFLLALEREEIVSVGYHEELIGARLDTMPISEQERQIIRHALLWIWKDEEMHAIYIRGAIFKVGAFSLRARALLRQLAGALGGWSTSVRQHVRWSVAPLSRAVATFLTWTGSVTGKVPPDVRQHLRYSSFRDFCLFNVDAEKTARLCWQRLIELTSGQLFMLPSLIDDFHRIKEDEDRHRQIFEILANALDQNDQLVPHETADSLAQKIRAVGESFLPRAMRSGAHAENPLGSGGRVKIVQGKALSEKRSLFRALLEDCLKDLLLERSSTLNKPLNEFRVAIKPAFMLGYDRRDQSMITDRELLVELGRFLAECGCKDVAVVEGRNLYDRFYNNRSVLNVAQYFDISSTDFRVVDLSEEQVPHAYFRGMAQYTVGKTWKDADFRISFAKMRSHPVDSVHLTIANLEGIGARCDQFLFAERQADRETATMMLMDEFPPHLSILDAYEQAADGLVGIMGCPRPPTPLRFYAGRDVLAVDMVASRHMGLTDPRDATNLRAACHWFGDPRESIEIDGRDEPLAGWRSPFYSEFSTILSFVALPVYVLGSGRGTLFVPEMDHNAFPPTPPRECAIATRALRYTKPLGIAPPKMIRRVVIIGAGMGGLTAALRLAQQGLSVRIIEARPEAGGLASAFQTDGFVFDAGPYILLDRPGLEWAFDSLALELSEHVTLRRIDDVYEVLSNQSPTVNFYADEKKTAAGIDTHWPGSGKLYERFVAEMKDTHERLSPLLHVSRPGPATLFRNRAFTRIPFLLRSLGSILGRTNLPQPVIDAIAIWTQIAGQRIDEAPSPMAFVPALIHSVGAFYPVEGIGSISRTLTEVATKAGVEFRYGTTVRSIVSEQGRVRGVETNQDEFVPADAIVSNYNGIGTYIEMLSDTPAPVREKLNRLPLQSPGACAYLAVRGEIRPPYLRFQLPGNGELCRLFVTPTVVAPELEKNGWAPARLISPMRHEVAEGLSIAEQRDYLDRLLAESWWQKGLDEFRVVATRVPAEWGAQYNLYRNSMNPVMTAGFMRAGRLAHKSPYARGLYLAGSSTHPGQWVSFCAISGILAADDLLEDLNK